MVESAYTADLKSADLYGHEGSSPSLSTRIFNISKITHLSK